MRVLIVTSRREQFGSWEEALQRAGVEVITAAPGRRDLYRALRAGAPDVVIVGDGDNPAVALEELRAVVARQHVGASVAFIISARRTRLPALATEAVDDVVDVNATPEEALVRVQRAAAQRDPSSIELGELVVCPAEAQVLLAGRRIPLSALQLRLLWHFALYPNRILTCEALGRRVWGSEAPASSRRVNICIRRLRERLGAFGRERLRSVVGQGYYLAVPETVAAATGRTSLAPRLQNRTEP